MSYHVIARWRAREGELAKVEAVLRQLAPAIRNEPGNEQFIVHRLADNPNEFVLYETYASEQAFLEHRQTQHFIKLVQEAAAPLLELRIIEKFSVVNY
jgi:(4S)-4-hydroxy-5-phosphonooxypentane-2,3-dione isomerase